MLKFSHKAEFIKNKNPTKPEHICSGDVHRDAFYFTKEETEKQVLFVWLR